MTTFADDQDAVLYELAPLPLADTDELRAALLDPASRWYAQRRLYAVAAAGLLADGKWNPLLHPRGKDGQFIDKWGFVRWLADGEWWRGRVTDIDEDGHIHVKPDNPKGAIPAGVWKQTNLVTHADELRFDHPTKQLYALPKPKASFNLPDVTTGGNVQDGWLKTSGQLGSNPGAMYEALAPQKGGAFSVSPETVKQVVHDHNLVAYPNLTTALDVQERGGNQDALFTYIDDGRTKVAYHASGDNVFMDMAGHNVEIPPTKVVQAYLGDVSELGEASDRIAALTPHPIEEGKTYYVKKAKSKDHARSEALASYLYEKAGLAVPDVNLNDERTSISSRVVEGDRMSLTDAIKDPELASEIRSGMTVDAWLANWDVTGLVLDNMVVVDGTPYRLDTGGALLYRAQGGPKGGMFGNEVGELQSFLNPSVNPASPKVFGGVTQAELKAGGERVASISPAEIKEAVDEMELPPSVADTLIARRKFILDHLGVDDPHAYKPKPLSSAWEDVPMTPVVGPLPTPPTPEAVLPSETPPDVSYSDKVAAENQYLEWFAALPYTHNKFVGQLVVDDLYKRDDQLWRVADVSQAGDIAKRVTAVDVATGNTKNYTLHTEDVLDIVSQDWVSDYQAQSDYLLNLSTAYDSKKNYEDLFADGEFSGIDMNRAGGDPIYTINGRIPATSLRHASGDSDKPMYIFNDTEGVLYRVDSIVDPHAQYDVPAGTPYSLTITSMESGEIRTMQQDNLSFADTWRKPTNAYTADLVEQKVSKEHAAQKADLLEDTNKFDVPEASKADVAVEETLIEDSPLPEQPLTTAQYEAAKAAAATPTVLPVSPPAKSVEGINSVLQPSDDPISLVEMQKGISDYTAQDLVGKNVVVLKGGSMHDDGYNTKVDSWANNGLFHVDAYVPSEEYKAGHLTLTSANGVKRNITIDVAPGGTALQNEPFGTYDTVLTPVNYDIGGPMPPLTLKKNGDIEAQGTVVGTYTSDTMYYKTFTLSIDPAYSVTGKKVTVKESVLKNAKRSIGALVVPPGPKPTKPKVELPHVAAVEAQVKAAPPNVTAPASPFGIKLAAVPNAGLKGPPEAVLADGTPVSVGMKVTSTKDGLSGTVMAFLGGATHKPGSVKILRDDNGKVTYRHATTFGLTEPPTPATPHPYADMPLADGTYPDVGMKVVSGKGDKQITGTIAYIMPSKKWIQVVPEGMTEKDKVWKTASVTVKHPDEPASPVSVAPTLPAAAAAGVLEKPEVGESSVAAKVEAKTKAAKTKAPNIPYPGPNGSVIQQSNETRAKWTENQGRKLTKDGYALQVGMRVRDSKGNARIVADIPSMYASQPSSIRLVDPETGVLTRRQSSALLIDHMGELTNTNGDDLPKIASISTIPPYGGDPIVYAGVDGGAVYRTHVRIYDPNQKRYKAADSYVVVSGGTVYRPGYGNVDNKSFFKEIGESQRPWVKVAVIDHSSTQTASYKPAKGNGYGANDVEDLKTHWDIADTEVAPEVVLAQKAKADADAEAAASAGILPAKTPDAANIQPLAPPPQPITEETLGHSGPQPPPIPAAPADLMELPDALQGTGAVSPIGAISELLKKRHSKAPGSGLHYGVGDGEYVEDMMFRTQMVQDTSGNEFVEVRFRMMEEKTDELSDQLVTMGQTKIGGWVKGHGGQQISVTDLVEGDHLAVRISGTTNFLKPDPNAAQPNATVLGPGVQIGTTKSGETAEWPTYRVPIALKDGTYGEVDIQLRDQPTINTHVYDPTAPVPVGTGGKEKLTPAAEAAGWSEAYGKMGYDGAGMSTVNVDVEGKKTVGLGAVGLHPWGVQLARTLDDGTVIHVNLASSKNGPTTQGASSSVDGPRRSEINGDVTVRIPIADAENHLANEVALSRAMSALGIPVEAQAGPTNAQLAKFAIGKVEKNYKTPFVHRERTKATGLPGDQATDQVLKHVDKAVGSQLGRPVTLNDVRVHVYDDGRLQVMMSPDVGEAISKVAGHHHYGHHHGNNVVEFLSSPINGLLGASERFSAGVFTARSSAPTDVDNGSGDRIYMTSYDDPYFPSSGLIFSPTVINMSTEIYANGHDTYGNHGANSKFWSKDHFENMYKRKIPIEAIAYVVVGSQRDNIIQKLHSNGVTHIGGRTIESIVVHSAPQAHSGWTSLGTDHLGTYVSLDQFGVPLVAPGVPEAPAAGAGEAVV